MKSLVLKRLIINGTHAECALDLCVDLQLFISPGSERDKKIVRIFAGSVGR
jgi:hypothetical protein